MFVPTCIEIYGTPNVLFSSPLTDYCGFVDQIFSVVFNWTQILVTSSADAAASPILSIFAVDNFVIMALAELYYGECAENCGEWSHLVGVGTCGEYELEQN